MAIGEVVRCTPDQYFSRSDEFYNKIFEGEQYDHVTRIRPGEFYNKFLEGDPQVTRTWSGATYTMPILAILSQKIPPKLFGCPW
jgi:hypothetical protein